MAENGCDNVKIGICDDEPEIRNAMAEKIRYRYPESKICLYSNGEEIINEKTLPDILFLDIQMPHINGMEAARRLRSISDNMIIIFVTVIEEYVFQAFDVRAFNYIVKPFEDERLYKILDDAVRECYEGNENKQIPISVNVSSGGRHFNIKVDRIVYAEVFNRKVTIHTVDEDIEYYGKLTDLQEKLGVGFYRPHRAYLVNFDYIRKYDAATIYLEKGEAAMAKKNYSDFVKKYMNYNRMKGNQR